MVTVLGANTLSSGGYEVDNSVRLFSNTSMTMTPSGAPTNADINTISFWCKLSALGSSQSPIAAAGNAAAFSFRSDHKLQFYNAGGTLRTDRLFRDVSAWYHVVVATDTTDGTANDRLKMYINGVQETSFTSRTNPNQNANSGLGGETEHIIGCNNDPANYFNGYIAEMCFIDGQALDPTSFGEFDEDSGIWKPIDVSGLTFGKNGFYLEFKSGGNLGDEDKGTQTADWSETNLTATDQTTDTCTNNFATLNPLYQQGDNAFSEGNCKVVLQAGDGTKGVASNIAVSSGKWYFEVKQGSSTNSVIQVREASDKEDDLSYYEGSYAGYQFNNGNQYITGNSSSAYGASYADGDIIMVALDMDNNRVYFGKNGSWNDGDGNADEANLNDYAPVNGVTDAIAAFGNANGSATATAEFNFGNPPYANSSSVSDGNGHGNFEFAVPSGYFALCTKNLAEHG